MLRLASLALAAVTAAGWSPSIFDTKQVDSGQTGFLVAPDGLLTLESEEDWSFEQAAFVPDCDGDLLDVRVLHAGEPAWDWNGVRRADVGRFHDGGPWHVLLVTDGAVVILPGA